MQFRKVLSGGKVGQMVGFKSGNFRDSLYVFMFTCVECIASLAILFAKQLEIDGYPMWKELQYHIFASFISLTTKAVE